MKNFYILILIIALFFLNGCAVLSPVTRLAGGVLNVAGNVAGMAASTAVKVAPVALPFLL